MNDLDWRKRSIVGHRWVQSTIFVGDEWGKTTHRNRFRDLIQIFRGKRSIYAPEEVARVSEGEVSVSMYHWPGQGYWKMFHLQTQGL